MTKYPDTRHFIPLSDGLAEVMEKELAGDNCTKYAGC